jgi:hypothetical protein
MDVDALCETLRLAERELAAVLSDAGVDPSEARTSLAWLRGVRARERGLRLVFVRVLHDAERAGVLQGLGYPSITSFLIGELRVSERTAQRMTSESWLFEGNAALANAFAAGRIGLGQAYLINRLAAGSTLEAFIRRAESVTHLEFEREVRLLERLKECAPDVAADFAGPLPHPGLEAGLRARLQEGGWTKSGIEDSVMARLPKLAREAMQEASGDSIWGPWQLRRLEILVEIVALAENEAPIWPLDEPPMLASEVAGENPPMLASKADTGPPKLAPNQSGGVTHPPMLAPRSTTISFWAPEDLVRRWQSAIRAMQEKAGPLPSWAAAIIILRHAVDEWERIDPSRRPAETPIYERDEWRCQAPGCSARRRLEAHHIIFKSAGGTDDPENLITLCHAHHRQGIHEDRVKLTGKAPWNLKWRMGSPGYRWQWSRPGNQSVILAGPS